MKLIISNYDDVKNPYYGGGGSVAVKEIAERLAKYYDVTVINSKHPLSKTNEKINGVFYQRIGLGLFGPKIDQVIFMVILPIYALLSHYDIWIEAFIPPISGSVLPVFKRKKIIGLAFFMDALSMQNKYHLPFKFFEDIVLRNYQNLITTSSQFEERVKNLNHKNNVKVIPIGIDEKNFNTQTSEKNYILYLGRIDIYNKGLDILMNIAPAILKSNNLKVIIAGSGISSDVKTLKNIIISKGLKDRIILEGKVSEEKKIELISKCLFYIFPSRYETFGISVLEVMAIGKAVIIFDIDGFKWIKKDCVDKVSAFSIEEFRERTLNLISNKAYRNKLSKNARTFSLQFRWDNIIEKHKDFINTIYQTQYEK